MECTYQQLRTLCFLRRDLYQCPPDVKEAAYRGLVRPVLEWQPCLGSPRRGSSKKNHDRAARFVASNYFFETRSMTGILENLKWESLKKRRRDSRLILLY